MAKKGIYCLECHWFGHRDRTSVQPILHLLQTMYGLRVPYLYDRTATREEFYYHLKKWKIYRSYPILYLGFHGESEAIRIGEGNGLVTLDDLEEKLKDSCNRRIIHFGSCSTLDIHGNRLNRFLKRTGALAVCGYRTEVDWLESAAMDLLVLGLFQQVADRVTSIEKLERLLETSAPGLQETLGFRIKTMPRQG